MDFFETIKPKLPKRYLLFLAAGFWTFAGIMLLYRGISLLIDDSHNIWVKLAISIVGGIAFYLLLFSKISLKHTNRIMGLKQDKPCMFSFFSFASYGLMAVMITTSIVLRKTGVIPAEYLPILYITMGIPLFLSAFRFYYYGFNYAKLTSSA